MGWDEMDGVVGLLNEQFPASFSFFLLDIQLPIVQKKLLNTEFEPGPTGVGSDCSWCCN